MKRVIVLGLALFAQAVWATQPVLTSVTQPLYFLRSAADTQIKLQSVPKIQTNASADAWVGLFSSPTVVDGSGGDLNLISIYQIDVRILRQAKDGRIEALVIDFSKAKKPDRYPFSIADVVGATNSAVEAMFVKNRPKTYAQGASGKARIYEASEADE